MFFKTKEVEKVKAKVMPSIESQIDMRSERILNEAKSILAESEINLLTMKNLEKIGISPDKLYSICEADEYKKKYPEYKYIANDDVLKLCEQYTLSLGKTCLFEGEIPIKNLLEINKALLRLEKEKVHREFYVIAPFQMFNISRDYALKIRNGKVQQHDPIVLYELKKGYLVISKWGEEENYV